MKGAYPTFIKQVGGDFLVYVPDWDNCTSGGSLEDAISMGRDMIGILGITYEDEGKELPKSSDYKTALEKAKKETEIMDFSDGILTMIDVDFAEYRKQVDNRAVRKNCTVPYWMTVEADKVGLNYSKVLQDAIAKLLNLNYNVIN